MIIKYYPALIITIAFIFLGLKSSKTQQPENEINVLIQKERNEGWQLLFDGVSIDNWKIFNNGEVKGWKLLMASYIIQVKEGIMEAI